MDGNEVRWNKWSFHFRMGQRVGLIVSLLRFEDQGRERMVLYRGSIAEMFVPYMDRDIGWSFRTYMDVGEYEGFGPMSSSLRPGIDCPADATFIEATLSNERGEPVLRKSPICMFERPTAAPLWRHTEVNGAYAGRPARELVLRTIPSAGNYDYIIDWVLTEAGALRIDVGATGIDEVKGVAARTMSDPSAKLLGDFPARDALSTVIAMDPEQDTQPLMQVSADVSRSPLAQGEGDASWPLAGGAAPSILRPMIHGVRMRSG